MKLLIKNGHVVDPATGKDGRYDILIENETILAVEKNITGEADTTIDASGLHVLPGLVDAHVHLREPGFEYKEDIATGTRSAAMGGVTSVACMPNTQPVTDNATVVRYIIDKARTEGVVNVFPIGAISKGSKGDELAEIGELKAAGAVAISDDGKPVGTAALMKKALQYSQNFGIRVISHCEDMSLAEEGLMNEGWQSTVMGLKGIPSAAEDVMIARDMILADYTGVPVHIAHISTEMGIDLVRFAKKRGTPLTAETCPHYFTLTDEATQGFNTLAKVNPPLRTATDRDAVIAGLKDGTIDVIATDHAPHHPDEKNVEFAQASNGLVGLETSLALTLTYLVLPGHLTLLQAVEKMSLNPARILGIPRGTLEPGCVADICLVDMKKVWTVDTRKFVSKSKNSPFQGFELTGKVDTTIVGGKVIVAGGELNV